MNGSNNLGNILKTYAQNKIRQDLEFARSIDTSKTVVSQKTLRKVRAEIRNYDRKSMWNELPLACRRIVAAILVVCTISFVMCLSVEAIRSEIVNTIVEWYDKFVSVFFVAETPPDEIEVYKEPTLQLEGVEKVVITKDSTLYDIIYTKEGKLIVRYQQKQIVDNAFKVDNEHNFAQYNVIINNYSALLFKHNNGCCVLTWNDGEYCYSVHSYSKEISTDYLTLIAESIK